MIRFISFILIAITAIILPIKIKDENNYYITDSVSHVKLITETAYRPIYINGKLSRGERICDIPVDTIFYFSEENKKVLDIDSLYDSTMANESTICKYDKNGNCIKRISYSDDNTILFTQTNSYDNLNRLSLSIVRNCSTGEIFSSSFTYDNNGLLRMKITNNNNMSISTESYLYDDNGNWRVKVIYENFSPTVYIERKIE